MSPKTGAGEFRGSLLFDDAEREGESLDSVTHRPDEDVDPQTVGVWRESVEEEGYVSLPLPAVRDVGVEADEDEESPVVIEDAPNVGNGRLRSELGGPAAVAPLRLVRRDLGDLLYLIKGGKERMLGRDLFDRVLG